MEMIFRNSCAEHCELKPAIEKWGRGCFQARQILEATRNVDMVDEGNVSCGAGPLMPRGKDTPERSASKSGICRAVGRQPVVREVIVQNGDSSVFGPDFVFPQLPFNDPNARIFVVTEVPGDTSAEN